MQPLNPFIRALFRSPIPGQAVPCHDHVILVPSTESLLYGRDRESGVRYADLVRDEEFLGSHVLRVPPVLASAGKESTNVRDSKGKAKSLTTVNGRTVIVKENMVYSNKGFRNLTQAQLLTDVLYSAADGQQWLLYSISKPLLGTFEPIAISPALIPTAGTRRPSRDIVNASEAVVPKRKEVKTFNDVLNNFPIIARQMQPGLERLFNEFGKELGKPLPPPPSQTSSTDSIQTGTTKVPSINGSISSLPNGSAKLPFHSSELSEDAEDLMRRPLETAVTSAIDLFQLVDKQQLSYLGATTDLTGPLVERLIERYVVEQVHGSLLFPRLCDLHRSEDYELEYRIRQMENIDVAQVGIAIERGRAGKEDFLCRLRKGVETFRRMGVASSPHEMVEILLATEKTVTEQTVPRQPNADGQVESENQNAIMTVNADILVSLLLIVVIRSQTRHLQARLAYMQRFIFIDDVESGETGYALSTFEAVLSYLVKDAGGLRRASARNKRLWEATKIADVSGMSAILESVDDVTADEELAEEPFSTSHLISNGFPVDSPLLEASSVALPAEKIEDISDEPREASNLAHVFPFVPGASGTARPVTTKKTKKVSMDMRSLSGSSAFSFKSRSTTIDSTTSGIEGDTSIRSLSQTQDPAGNSIMMMAVESRQPESLRYLLTLREYYPIETVLEDTTSEGTTLLSAAIQLAHTELIDIILHFISASTKSHELTSYLAKADTRGRTAAHYLFNAPHLMRKLAGLLPWTRKDKIGQTPLFALCRSYDHPDYGGMVSDALDFASQAQGDGKPLRLEDHTDNKGNTLLHIINDPPLAGRILRHCDADPNAVNDKRFTPLMLASKYGRIDMVRIFFSDARVDVNLKELRGLTAVELAKDDEIRNRIDDLTLLSRPGSAGNKARDGRVTTIVRSYFVEDGSTRFIVKSGAPSNASDPTSTTFTITTSRRTLQDFENLADWLSQEHPASYIPFVPTTSIRSPFQIHSRPSRAVLHDTQNMLDRFLKILLAHPTFATHEALWEFFLVPDMQQDQIAQRSNLKAQILEETIADEYEPIQEVRDVEQLVAHSRDMIRSVSLTSRNIVRRGHQLQHAQSDLSEAIDMAAMAFKSLGPPCEILPISYVDAFARSAALMATNQDSSPLTSFIHASSGIYTTVLAIQTSLLRPTTLISHINAATQALARNRQNLNAQSLPRKFNFPGMEESRVRGMKETERKIIQDQEELIKLGKQLRYTQEVVVGELAGWTDWREQAIKISIRTFAHGMVIRERERGLGLARCLRALRVAKEEFGKDT